MRADPAAAGIERRARDIADDLLFPAALGTDRTGLLPPGHFRALAGAGLYGIAGPAGAGGLDCDAVTTGRLIEILASGCLATTFVWIQHHSTVRALAASANAGLRADWLPALCQGAKTAGIALGGARPGPPLLRARPVPGGWSFDGSAPWVTGWGLVDVVLTIGRTADGDLVGALLPATATATLTAGPLDLVAVNASRTVELTFRDHFVPAELVTAVFPQADWLAGDEARLRPNGSLALGVAARCTALAAALPGEQPVPTGEASARPAAALAAAVAECRRRLDLGTPEDLPAARAAAAELAFRAAGTLVAATGSQAIRTGGHPQRLAREALFLLVFGSRPAIKASLVGLLQPAR
jgi:alkylation response protein AidB-like acyl-CoA dehydrogenase